MHVAECIWLKVNDGSIVYLRLLSLIYIKRCVLNYVNDESVVNISFSCTAYQFHVLVPRYVHS